MDNSSLPSENTTSFGDGFSITRRKFIKRSGKTTLAVILAAGALSADFRAYGEETSSDSGALCW